MKNQGRFYTAFFEGVNLTLPEIRFKVRPWLLLWVLFVAYILWEVYWYNNRGLQFIKWHTHLAVYVFIWMLGASVLWVRKRSLTSNGFLSFTAIMFSLFIVEVFLIFSGITKTYLEKVTGHYYSQYIPQDSGYYHAWPLNKEHWIKKPEFTYWRPTNSEGLGDVEWPLKAKPGQRRIMALGDSFTEGDGAPYDSTYVVLLRDICWASGDSSYFMNAGVLGSDPFFNYIMLKDRLLKYQPDVVIQALSSQDMITDILLRGGMERFAKNGMLKYTQAPWWEPIYAANYMVRLFFMVGGYNELLQKRELSAADKQKLDQQMIGLLENYAQLCKQNGIRFFLLVRPDQKDLTEGKYEYDFSFILNHLKSNKAIEVIDLLPAYKTYLATTNTVCNDYFWQQDSHHNSKGYAMMATTLYTQLAPLLSDTNGIAK